MIDYDLDLDCPFDETGQMVILPEMTILQSAATMVDDESNSFKRLLLASQIYKEADMTPIYLLDVDKMTVQLVTIETYGKKLH